MAAEQAPVAPTCNTVEAQEEQPIDEKAIDHKKVCPMLVRLFPCINEHNSLREYGRNRVPAMELQLHTWKDCTLLELMRLVKKSVPEARRRGTVLQFSIVCPDSRSMVFRSRIIGTTHVGIKQGMEDNKTLADCQYVPGDYIDVAIIPPSYGSYGRGRGIRRQLY